MTKQCGRFSTNWLLAVSSRRQEAEYQQTVIRLMTEMRFAGDLPYHWVVDESRRVRITQTFDNVADAIEHTARFYRRSALAQSPDYVEIWCEKDALVGCLWDVTSDYDVPLMVSRGMPSLTFSARLCAGDPARRRAWKAFIRLSIRRPRSVWCADPADHRAAFD
ncbi:hypothetical protein ACFIOY_37755 [Bradyrhizobium sp. TZ2]